VANCDNPKAGADFERLVQAFFSRNGVILQLCKPVPVGAGIRRKFHKFDLGSEDPPVLVECKCHAWTGGGNAPSAKLTVWNEAMLYFAVAPPHYRKILAVQKSLRLDESLAEHYLRRFGHLIPAGVELWEFDPISSQGVCVYGSRINV
jgi:hypothetical protein